MIDFVLFDQVLSYSPYTAYNCNANTHVFINTADFWLFVATKGKKFTNSLNQILEQVSNTNSFISVRLLKYINKGKVNDCIKSFRNLNHIISVKR